MKTAYLFNILKEENLNEIYEGVIDGRIYQIGRHDDGEIMLCEAWGDPVYCTAKHITQGYFKHVPREKKCFSKLRLGDIFYIIADFEEVGEVHMNEDEEPEYWKSFVENGYAFKKPDDAQARLEELQLLGKIAKYQNENDTVEIDWDNFNERKWYITYSDVTETLWVAENRAGGRILGVTYFGSRDVAKNCIEEFEDELLNYFRRSKE